MKKLFAAPMLATAALCCVLGLSGCGSSSTETPQAEAETSTGTVATDDAETEEEAEPEEAAAPDSDYAVTIDGARLSTDYEGNECVIVTYTWTNNSEETTSAAAAVYAKVFQNGVQCETAFVTEDIDSTNYSNDVRPGTSVSYEIGYEISDHSEIEVEVSELFSLDDTLLASAKYAFE